MLENFFKKEQTLLVRICINFHGDRNTAIVVSKIFIILDFYLTASYATILKYNFIYITIINSLGLKDRS